MEFNCSYSTKTVYNGLPSMIIRSEIKSQFNDAIVLDYIAKISVGYKLKFNNS